MSFQRLPPLLFLAALSMTASACGAVTTTVVLVRHAEKGPGSDPDLTEEGAQRALALVSVTRRAGVVAALHTQFKRTEQTASPLSTEIEIPLVEVPYKPGLEAEHAEAVVRLIESTYAGKTVVVVGHTTTLPVIMARLGVTSPPTIAETEYGNVFIVVRQGSGGKMIRGRYGP